MGNQLYFLQVPSGNQQVLINSQLVKVAVNWYYSEIKLVLNKALYCYISQHEGVNVVPKPPPHRHE